MEKQNFSFSAKIKQANSAGTGFIHFPHSISLNFTEGDFAVVQFLHCRFFVNIVHVDKKLGVYIPKYFTLYGQLIGTTLNVIIQTIDGFYASVARDGTVYLPHKIITDYNLDKNDIIALTVFQNENTPVVFYRKIYVLVRESRRIKEYIIRIPKLFSKQNVTFQIRKLSPHFVRSDSTLVSYLVQGMNFAFTESRSLVVFQGHKIPSLLNANLEWIDIARYLGAYFSDGTKKGNSWAIAASTFSQGRWYLQMHKKIISDANPDFVIVYTAYDSFAVKKELEEKLQTEWEKEIGVPIKNVRFVVGRGQRNNKWHEHGTLVIREHRQILLSVYRNLLIGFIEKLDASKDKNLAWEFLFGILEGDGCAPAARRGHLLIATNQNEYPIIEKILSILQLRFKTIKEENNQFCKYYIRIGVLELLRNFSIVEPRIFSYYPSRRNLFFRRLHTTGVARFFTQDHTPASWVKTWLQNNGFVGFNYQLTHKGGELRTALVRTMI